MSSKRKREPWDYREYYPSHTSSRKRRKSVADYTRSSAQQQHIYNQNSVCSPLLRLPAEIRNEIYSYVLSNQVVHISVRECPLDDTCSWSHAEYYRVHKSRYKNLDSDKTSFLKFTHSLCTLPFGEEDYAHARAAHRNHSTGSKSRRAEDETSYRIRHTPCYRALARLKGNWIRDGEHVTVSPFFKPASSPGLSVSFLQTCRQIYSESRDLVYTSNTFAFHEGNTLDLFLSKCLSTAQRALITSIQLDGWNGDDYDPGSKARPETLRHLTGLKSLCVAVTNTYLNHHVLRFYPMPDTVESGKWHPEVVMQKGEGQSDVVKVTVDPLVSGSVEVVELEQLVKRNVEAALGI